MDIKKGRKKWCSVIASENFNNLPIGEIPCYSAETLVGRSLWVNLAHLSNDVKDHSIKVRFKINKIVGEKAETELIGYDLLNTYMKRIVRPGRDKIDDSFIVNSNDKVRLRVKMVYIARSNINKRLSREIMMKGREIINDFFGKTDYNSALNEIIANRLQRNMKSVLNKIYPLSSVDVRKIELLK